MMNIKQAYSDIYKDLCLFLETHSINKKIKKNNLNTYINNVDNTNIYLDLNNVNKNKSIYDRTIYNEETNYRTINEITKFENNRVYTDTSLINFSNNSIYNVIRESESILNVLKPAIINKSKKKNQSGEKDFYSNPYSLLRINQKNNKLGNSNANSQILTNLNLLPNNIDSTFNFDYKFDSIHNNSYMNNQNYNNKNNTHIIKESENTDNKLKKSYDKTLTEHSYEYENSLPSRHKKKIDCTIEINENLTENLFLSAINFENFKEFPSFYYNKISNGNNDYINNENPNYLNLNPIGEEHEFEENIINENLDRSDIKNNLEVFNQDTIIIKKNDNIRENTNVNQINVSKSQNLITSLGKNSYDGVPNINNDFFALQNLNQKLSNDNSIQVELNILNQNNMKKENKKKVKGLKEDNEISLNFYQLMINYLNTDLKISGEIQNVSIQNLMKKKIINESINLISKYHGNIELECQLEGIKSLIKYNENDHIKDENNKHEFIHHDFKSFDNFNNNKEISSKKIRQSKRSQISFNNKENFIEGNKTQLIDLEYSLNLKDLIKAIKHKAIPLLQKSEKLLIINDFNKLKENEKDINAYFNRTKAYNNLDYNINNNYLSQTANYINKESESSLISKNNSKSLSNTEILNKSSKNDLLMRTSLVRNRDSILYHTDYSTNKMEFGTPNEVFEDTDIQHKNYENLKIINKYLNTLNDIITEEESNFNNNFFTNLETNYNNINNNLNEFKNYKNQLNFEDLPEENEIFNEGNESGQELDLENGEILNTIKQKFIKNAILEYIELEKDNSIYSGNERITDSENLIFHKIDFFEINKIFYESIENSEFGYIEKENILKNNSSENIIGNFFYNLLIACQRSEINLSQRNLFGEIYFE